MPATTAHTITDLGAMVEELARVREVGYAVDDGEQELGVRCVAVAVNATTAVSVSGPASRVTRRAVPALAEVLSDAAHALAGRQGRRG
jgi:IclR family acetate operon transcriptional repressor